MDLLVGERFGSWTVIGRNTEPYKTRAKRFDVVCDCGNKSIVTGVSLRKGRSTACRSCKAMARAKKHGLLFPPFCSYLYFDEERIPRYVGEGTKRRPYENSSSRKYPRPDDESLILVLKRFDTKQDALRHEEYMIDVLGTIIDGTGPLYNISPGRNRKHSSTREKLRELNTGVMLGTKRTPEQREMMSQAQYRRWTKVKPPK